MHAPICSRCPSELEWQQKIEYRCPNGHYERLDGVTELLLESVFADNPSLYTMFWKAFSLPIGVFTENDPEWNTDIIAEHMGTTEHKVHLFIYADLAQAERAVQVG